MLKSLGKDKPLIMKKIILASTSKYRKALFDQLGYPFECEDPQVDESPLKELALHPEELALKLSHLKARAVFARHLDALVIGSDQVCYLNNEVLSKPKNFEIAKAQLKKMSGKAHKLFTAVSICTPEKELSFTNTTTLHMRVLSDLEIEKYLNADEPYDCAGSYKLESLGIRLFSKIEMSDHTSIIGLPLIQLNNALIELGYHS